MYYNPQDIKVHIVFKGYIDVMKGLHYGFILIQYIFFEKKHD
jgi:hypothetical protein